MVVFVGHIAKLADSGAMCESKNFCLPSIQTMDSFGRSWRSQSLIFTEIAKQLVFAEMLENEFLKRGSVGGEDDAVGHDAMGDGGGVFLKEFLDPFGIANRHGKFGVFQLHAK